MKKSDIDILGEDFMFNTLILKIQISTIIRTKKILLNIYNCINFKNI